jgi:hypothetical protein
MIAANRELIESYRAETERMQREIEELSANTRVFQVSRCTACSIGHRSPLHRRPEQITF